MKTKEKIKKISVLLNKEYGKKVWRSRGEPLSVLIGTILSQNTSDNNSHQAFENLKRSFKNWESVRKAPINKIENAVRHGGLAKIKAKRIKDILNQIKNDNHNTSLSQLRKMKTQEVIDYLGKFKGVGEKTIACVLLFSLGRPFIPVDTHVFRLSKRLGLIPKKADSNKAHTILQKEVYPNLVYSFHLNLIRHGREVCKAKNPSCGDCVLFDLCQAPEKNKFIKKGERLYAKN
ncbi:MAG: hypothetical protein AMJ90_06430 [candidate division Zixibacteria bacterium SM23_73_2]|nr:MAG: hypothetical protein AMJ90_06430 [candidate division Zixibacteria bacterium SM23_73_2]